MFERLDTWLLHLDDRLQNFKPPELPEPSECGAIEVTSLQLPSPALTMSLPPVGHLSPQVGCTESPGISMDSFSPPGPEGGQTSQSRAKLARMDSVAQNEARLASLRYDFEFQEIEKSKAVEKQQEEAENIKSGLRYSSARWADWLLNTQTAHIFFGLVVVSNSMFLGIQLEYQAQVKTYSSAAEIFMAIHVIYAILFTIEVCLHIVAEGIRHYLWCPSACQRA